MKTVPENKGVIFCFTSLALAAPDLFSAFLADVIKQLHAIHFCGTCFEVGKN